MAREFFRGGWPKSLAYGAPFKKEAILKAEIERLQKIIGKQAIEKMWEISKERKRRRVSLMRPIGQFFKRSRP